MTIAAYSKWVCFWECRHSPKITPFSSSTAAPVSSQLVSIPKTSLGGTELSPLLTCTQSFIQKRTGPVKALGFMLVS